MLGCVQICLDAHGYAWVYVNGIFQGDENGAFLMAKKLAKIVGGIVGAITLILIAYVIYVMATYYRLDDRLILDTQTPRDGESVQPYINCAQPVTLVSANVGFGAYGPDFDFFMDGGSGSVAPSAAYVSSNVDGLAQSIKNLDPDVVLFQEVDMQGTRSCNVNEYELLRDEFASDCSVFIQNYDSPYLAWPLYAPHGKNQSGLATFSAYEITQTLRRSLPLSESISKFLDLDRCFALSRIPVSNGKELVVFNVHLSAYGADAEVLEGQRAMLFEAMQEEYAQGNYVIAGGDFNHDLLGVSNEVYGNVTDTEASWAKPFAFEEIPDGFILGVKDQFDQSVFNSAATCRDAGRPYDGTNDRWVMDGFIYSDNIDCIEQRTLDLDFRHSDHNPVYVTCVLRAE